MRQTAVSRRRNVPRVQRRPEPVAPIRRQVPAFAFAAVLVLVGAWAYSNSFAGVFVLDDVRAIVRNASIRALWPISTPLSPPTASTVAGRPVANLTFAINYALAPADAKNAFTPRVPGSPTGQEDQFRRNAWGYHALNLLIHLASALALFGIVRRTLRSPRLVGAFGDVAGWLAFAVGVLWVAHPLTTAAVTYVVQRVESLMALFYLLTLYAAIRAGDGPRRHAWIAAAAASCALGMGSKEVMVTAPVTVWLWYRTFGTESTRPGRWLWLGLAASWVVFALAVAYELRAPSLSLEPGVAWRYLLTQAAVLTHYLRLAFVPSPLVFLYDWPLVTSVRSVAPQAALIVSALVLTLIGVVRRHPLGFAGAWFLVVLAPTSSVVPIVTEVAAEHRMYLPLAGVIAGVVIGGYALARRMSAGPSLDETGSRWAAGVAVTALVLALVYGTMTRQRNSDYGDAVTLWGTAVAAQPAGPRPRVAYGEALASAGRLAEAEAQLTAGTRLDPASAPAWVRLGTVQAAQGKMDEAIASLEHALAIEPDNVDAHRGLGRAYAMRQRDAAAIPHLERALAAQPDDIAVLVPLAAILAEANDPMVRNPRRAIALAEQGVAATSRRDPQLLELLAGALAADNRISDAAAVTREALAVARANGNTALAARLEERLRAYDMYAGFAPR
jgi:tetratricopeptide (TPR) repeat protein